MSAVDRAHARQVEGLCLRVHTVSSTDTGCTQDCGARSLATGRLIEGRAGFLSSRSTCVTQDLCRVESWWRATHGCLPAPSRRLPDLESGCSHSGSRDGRCIPECIPADGLELSNTDADFNFFVISRQRRSKAVDVAENPLPIKGVDDPDRPLVVSQQPVMQLRAPKAGTTTAKKYRFCPDCRSTFELIVPRRDRKLRSRLTSRR
ncbi:hypothetical protein BU15DRAFT_65163 [Melanogaster broomeanus]|nr:hypothetical protein BU15DRAFT_65163 [Melanogaster broomeanus]